MSYVVPESDLRKQAKADGITHLSTGVAIVKGDKILVVRRAQNDFLGGNFELPGGGVEPGETFAESVIREVLEETGLHVKEIVGMFPGFDYSTPVKPKVRQFNFIVKTTDDTVVLSSEHDQLRWVGMNEINMLATTGPMSDCLKAAFLAMYDDENHSD